jgi:flagella basal body P-ring formation protein FlgA
MRFLAVLLVAIALCQGETIEVRLRPDVTLAADRATLGDLAELAGDPQMVAQLAPLTVLDLPGLGEHLVDARTVRQSLGRAAVGRLSVSGACRLRRAIHTITPDELSAAARATVQANGDELQVEVVRTSSALAVPAAASPPTLIATPLDKSEVGEIPFTVRAVSGTRELGRSLVTLRIDRFRTVPVAARDLRRGEKLSTIDVVMRKLPIRGKEGFLEGDSVPGHVARLDIVAGSPFTALNLLLPRVVRGGSQVTVQIHRAGFDLSSAGVALADGDTGDRIPVRRATDGLIITARITGPGAVTPAEP